MKKLKTTVSSTFIGAALLAISGAAAAAPVTLSNFSSSQPDRFVIPSGDLIGSIFDLPLLNFKVTQNVISDTLSFLMTAAPGEIIREVILREEGNLTLIGIGLASATGEITVNGISKTAGNFFLFSSGGTSTFGFENSGSALFNFSEADNITSAIVTISNSISAGAQNGGTIEKTLAKVSVTTSLAAPVPPPPLPGC